MHFQGAGVWILAVQWRTLSRMVVMVTLVLLLYFIDYCLIDCSFPFVLLSSVY